MKFRVSILLMAVTLIPCNAQPPAPRLSPPAAPAAVAAHVIPPPDYSTELPLEQPDPSLPKFCLLGTSCKTMDKRPFKACLLDGRHCDGAPPVALLVAQPKPAKAAAR